MITEKDLHEAIAECEGQRNPNANTCIKLASYYTILNQMNKQTEPVAIQTYSRSTGSIDYESDTEFMVLAKEKDAYDVWKLIDELISTIQVLHPNLYRGFIRHMTELKG